MWKYLTAAPAALLLLGSPALARMEIVDTDADGLLSADEFGIGADRGGVFDDWDGDDDALLAEDEWDAGWQDDIYVGADSGAFDAFDEDEDGFLDRDEFDAAIFESYDDDGDGRLSQEEWGVYDSDEWF